MDETFDAAEEGDLLGVVLAMQADTWDPLPSSAQQAVVDRIAARTAAFEGAVLLLQGDSHTYLADNPLALDNFTRIVVHGEALPLSTCALRSTRSAAGSSPGSACPSPWMFREPFRRSRTLQGMSVRDASEVGADDE